MDKIVDGGGVVMGLHSRYILTKMVLVGVVDLLVSLTIEVVGAVVSVVLEIADLVPVLMPFAVQSLVVLTTSQWQQTMHRVLHALGLLYDTCHSGSGMPF